ncbi:hypothetical protein HPT25_22670 [Bacillus sp. BRMEA1]|uniref:hypothetical protein n=1 Tax=Neobacillus endophyticus TaxID=2738405 RepID=UPI001565EFA9|nr:hypothetical protein [Neobacillus endophyticus]NRD80145.1 hypothetical protein [Neobacillus endophyticus]
MGYLEDYAKKKKTKENKSKNLNARVTPRLYNQFMKYIHELGLSVTESITIMIERELLGNSSESYQAEIEALKYEIAALKEKLSKAEEKIMVRNITENPTKQLGQSENPKKESSKSKRFRYPYKITEGKITIVPCPICEKWFDLKNFSRHAKEDHHATTQLIYENCPDMARKMYEKKMNEEDAR